MLDTPVAISTPAPAEIVVTASRVPETPETTTASVSLVDHAEIAHLGAPLVSDYLHLLPSVAVATSGPPGSLTEVRIRGAEANHTLLFIDGIRANDPAAGNEPRFELLNADIASRIELVRGPQSAVWGSEAIGGVVAVTGDPGVVTGATLLGEAGSFATYRGAAVANLVQPGVTASIALAGQKSRGTDAFDGTGDKDGYDNASVRGRVVWQAAPKLELGASGFAISGLSEFDGLNADFVHADTLDNTRNKLGAARGWASYGALQDAFAATVSASLLGSSNLNRLDQTELNRTRADRRTVSAELRSHFGLGSLDQHLVGAVEQEDEHFHSRDLQYGGATDQDRSRRHRSLTVEWKGDWNMLGADFAVRRDAFNRFHDATTVRAALLARLSGGFAATLSYGEGIAQPTFFDLYGFFPGSFAGNPALNTERSRGLEASLRWRNAAWSATATIYRQRLRDEIVGVYDPVTSLSTTINGGGTSHRQGAEVEAAWSPSPALRFHLEGAFLEASEPAVGAGAQIKEVRRPKWSGSLTADGERGKLSYGASLAYTGARTDNDFDFFPAPTVRLGGYVLASARLGYRIASGVELFGRMANAFDRDYRDVVGYRPSGRSIDGGIRLALGR